MLKRIISSLALLISLFILLDHALLFPTYSNIPPTTDTCTYANDYFTFEYPENWSYQEFRSFLTLYDESNRLVANIWIGLDEDRKYPIGENEESYAKMFAKETSKDSIEVVEVSHLEIDGYNTDKLIAIFKRDFKNYKIVNYIIDFSPRINISVGDRARKTDFLLPQLDNLVHSFQFSD